MYTSFFGLTEKPFAITPDPRYLYLSERHAEALAHLAYGISEAGGFIQLTGEVGTGKTTVLRSLLQQLPPHCDVALILNPRVTPAEFLQCICDELHVQVPATSVGSVKLLVDLLTHFLLDAHGRGRRIVLMVDEAQNLSADVLEQVRLLTNLETATQKLLQIILIGQPELRAVLAQAGTAPARAARDGPLSPGGAPAHGDHRLHPPSLARGRRDAGPVHVGRASANSIGFRAASRASSMSSPIARCSAPTRARSIASRALRAARGVRGLWTAGAAALVALGGAFGCGGGRRTARRRDLAGGSG